MQAGSIDIERALPIDAALLGEVLTRFRRDVPAQWARWTLGVRGAVEVDLDFTPAPAAQCVHGPAWSTATRLWEAEELAITPATVEVTAVAADECRLRLATADTVTCRAERLPALRQLASAAVDELAEELLWHASRCDIAHTGA